MLNNFIKKIPALLLYQVILKCNEIIFLVACLVVKKIISQTVFFFFKIFFGVDHIIEFVITLLAFLCLFSNTSMILTL